MVTKCIKKCIDEDELGSAAERETARQTSLVVTRLAPRSSNEHLDSEESELAEAGLVRLPEESLPNSFWKMPRAARLSEGCYLGSSLGAGRRLMHMQLGRFNCGSIRLYLHSYEARMRLATRLKVLTAF
jgi:hypothetical protein